MPCRASAKGWRLLRVLLVRIGEMPACSGTTRLLRLAGFHESVCAKPAPMMPMCRDWRTHRASAFRKVHLPLKVMRKMPRAMQPKSIEVTIDKQRVGHLRHEEKSIRFVLADRFVARLPLATIGGVS